MSQVMQPQITVPAVTRTFPRAANSDASDTMLHRRLMNGDEAALGQVYERHAPVLFKLARRVTGSLSAAEEVTQAVFLDVWRRPQRFNPAKGSLRTWLATITHHRSVDWVREEDARRRREHSFESRVAHLPSLEETVAATITAARVRLAVDSLSEKERTAIGLAYFGGRTYRQVAEELGVPEGTIKSRIRTGLARLEAALGAEHDGGRDP